MIDFASLNGITIPEGKVIKIEAGGKVLWREAKYRYVSLGDSIAVGHSIDSNWEKDYGYHTQYGENGNTSTKIVPGSYTDLIGKELETTHGAGCVSIRSFAHSGDRVNDLIGKLDHAVVQNTIKNADLVTICIGANDILGPALSKLEDYIDMGDAALDELAIEVEARLVTLNDDSNPTSYRALFNKLAAINPNAKYVFTNIYNPYKYLWIEEGHHGFFGPIINTIPTMEFMGIDFDSFIKDSLLGTPIVQQLFDRVNGLNDWAEKYISRLNQVLQSAINRYQTVNRNFMVTDIKQLFEVFPDRPYAAVKKYNDLVNVEYTRNYNTATMDWGRLWVGSDAGSFWWGLARKHGIDIGGLASDLVAQMIEKVIVPDIDPHPERTGHYVIKRSIMDTLGWQALDRYTITYVANGGTGSVTNQVVLGVDGWPAWTYIRSNGFTPPATGYYWKGWKTAPDGGTPYSQGQYISLNYNLTLYAQWSNMYTITVHHSYDIDPIYAGTMGYDDSDTGPDNCYAVWISGSPVVGGEHGLSLGEFFNGPITFEREYGTAVGVIAQVAKGSARSYITENGVQRGEKSKDARWGFTLTGHMDIHFEWNCFVSGITEQSYWNCYVKT